MKTKLIITAILFSFGVKSQLPYEWNPGQNPNWTVSNNSNYALSYQDGNGAVSTSNYVGGNWRKYNNSQNSRYTSPSYAMKCEQTDRIHITMTPQVNLENSYGFIYFEHSEDGGLTGYTPSKVVRRDMTEFGNECQLCGRGEENKYTQRSPH